MRERALFFQAIEMSDSEQRNAFLDEACVGDQELRQRVDALLKASDRAGAFLDLPELESSQVPHRLDRVIESNREAGDQGSKDWECETAELPQGKDELLLELDFLEPATEPEILGRLAHYEILEVIGRGGFGIVLRAHDTKLARDVAIKVMMPHLATTSPPRKRFLREARACAAIQHPNVISVYSVEEEPSPYLVMEWVRGSTLQDLINQAGPLEVSEILPLAHQLALALEAAHGSGLIHRDIKPSNVLIDTSQPRRIVITDFGLARTVDDISLTRSGFIAGTPMYMAPEQANGSPVDSRADLFSLGSVLYIMVTGRPPFRASSSAAVMHRVIHTHPRAVREVIPNAPNWLCEVISKLQAKQPEDRFESSHELASLLAACQADLLQFGEVQAATRILPQLIPAAARHPMDRLQTPMTPQVPMPRAMPLSR
jgi:serine/threonine protein kinase